MCYSHVIYIEQHFYINFFCTDVLIIVLVGLAVGFVVCTVVIVLVCRRKRSTGTVLRTSGVPHTRLVNCPGKTLVTLISRHNKMSENNIGYSSFISAIRCFPWDFMRVWRLRILQKDKYSAKRAMCFFRSH